MLDEGTPVTKLNEAGEILAMYDSIADAAYHEAVEANTIRVYLRNKQYGFVYTTDKHREEYVEFEWEKNPPKLSW